MKLEQLTCSNCGSNDLDISFLDFREVLKCKCCGTIFSFGNTEVEDKAAEEVEEAEK